MIIKFQLLDADYFLNGNKPVIRLFGRDDKGKAVCIFYDKMQPYFYAKCGDPRKLAGINAVNIERVEKFLPVGYQKDPTILYKITLANPQDVPKVKDQLLSSGLVEDAYEADILFKYRFMVDRGIYGMKWLEVDGERVNTVVSKVNAFRANSIKPLDIVENARLNYMAFDIECVPSDPRKPLDSKKDPIVMISLSFNPEYRGKKSLVIVSKPIQADGVQSFASEKEMLEEFVNIINSYDPDVLTGYNINGFDFPYIIERLKQNKLPQNLGRTDKITFSRTLGITQEYVLTGRTVADPYQILKRDPWVKFPRYDLNTVSKMLLNEQKHDIEYGEMSGLWNGERAGLMKFIEYARKDADLSMKLVLDKGLLDKFIELSKISGLLLQDVMGGQTRRIETMILHEFRKKNFVMPLSPSKAEMIRRTKERDKQALKGAIVLDPKKGLHAEGCVLVLDFKSLYPSIMRTYNVSPDTLTTEGKGVHQSPSGAYFVDQDVREGLLPNILSHILAARSAAKKIMKTKSGEERRMLNAKQLALKDISNSFYGYTGYTRARLYTIDVANTITAYGRKNIEKTRKLVEENFPVEVVYGDTDSIFVKTKLTNLDDAKELGEKISKFVTAELPGHLELDFEKIYRTFLILTKKRYAGWRFDKTDAGWQDSIEMRGIETVRRDWCLTGDTLVQMSDGTLRQISDMPDNCSVMTINPNTLKLQKDISIAKSARKSKVLRLITGFTEVNSTPDHKFFAFSDGHFQFKRTADLKKGDYVIQAKTIGIEGEPQRINFTHELKSPGKNINIPHITTDKLCQTLGFVFGDGSVVNRKITLYNKDLSLLEHYNKLFTEIFEVSGKLYTGKGCYNMVFFSKKLEMLFRHLGMDKRDKIPGFLHRLPKNQLAAFLRGYFDADGGLSINNKTASKGRQYLDITFAANSKRVAEEVKLLLLRFGIWSSNLRLHKSLGTAYEFSLKCENARLFLENVGFTNKKIEFERPKVLKGKTERLPMLENARLLMKKAGYSPTKFLRGPESATLTKSTACSIVNFVSEHCTYLDDEGLDNLDILNKVLQSDISFTRVEKVEDAGEAMVYDIDTMDTDTFLANGLLSHNCPLVSELMLQVLNTILKEGDLSKAIEMVKTTINDLKTGKIQLEKLTIIKGITKNVESYEGMLPHIELARKLTIRNPQDPPKIGDRLGFVIIKGDQMLSKRAEDPKYVAEHNIQLDSEYYTQSQLFPPIERIFTSVGIQKSEVFGSGRQASLGDIISGNKRVMKHSIEVDYGKPLDGWEDFVCKKCSRSYRRMPLNGVCECGGEMLIGFQGSTSDKVSVK